MFLVNLKHQSNTSGLFEELKLRIGQLPTNPGLNVCVELAKEITTEVDPDIINRMDEMGWKITRIGRTEVSRFFAFTSKSICLNF